MNKVMFGSAEIDLDAVSDNAKAQFASLQFLEAQMAKLQNEIAVYQTARAAYVASLKTELSKVQ